jgi:quercetin dioxygenase-like cupin family protein
LKVVNEADIEKKTVDGERGKQHMINLVEQRGLVIGTRIILQNSSVPPKPHSHKRRQINYIIDGEPSVTNGKVTIKLKKGDFVVLESFEEHYYSTNDEPAHTFEVQFE